MKRIVWVLALLSILCAPLFAAEPSVQLRVDVNPKTITIGDPIHYSLIVFYSSSIAASPLAVPQPWGDFETLAAATVPAHVEVDKIRLEYHLMLTTFSTGTLTIPSIALQFMVPGGQVAEAKTEEVQITVRSLLAEKGDIGNLMPLKGLFTFKSYLWIWILLGVLVLAGAAVGVWRWIKISRGEAGIPQGPPRPPEEIIWEVIDRLERSDLLATGQIKEYYSQLSQALRQYLEYRFPMPALDRTTSELLVEFRRIEMPLDHQSILRYFFDTGDLVKFAKYVPSEEEISDDLERVKKFVALTTPKKEESTLKTQEKIPL